jgi:two-component system chemotaxis response regulator CheY
MTKGKILIVDDEQDVRDIFQNRLEKAGYNPIMAENGEEAIKVLRSGDNMVNVGLIFCDIRMPKVNGVECIEFLRDQAPGIPIVVVTGYPDTEVAKSLLKKGIKHYLIKPLDKDKMLSMVEEIIFAGKDFSMP